ncbi:hypothetical protein BCY91_02215 [Pelobium manganitolerans]|uniref:Response regulatory domain-containing protein n=1 Tax=Pelobium manganitolerans TaxID=1842495 RepID=A0A419S6V1_9SPHI|nr:response regulator [Pelobium manganitolerans]RKD16989.1 hypothetical protein BCY91_02215 [Pelobium manganitolerans]
MKRILLVEDNPDYQLFFKLKFDELALDAKLLTFSDGFSFLTHLAEEACLPSVILLDLDLPGISGFDILERLKIDPKLKKIPVVILSSSECKPDIEKSYQLNANSYVVKPIGLEATGDFINYVHKYWLNFNQVA